MGNLIFTLQLFSLILENTNSNALNFMYRTCHYVLQCKSLQYPTEIL